MQIPTSSDYLLVPMNVQAAVINTPMLNSVAFIDQQMAYQNLNQFQSPAPAPFASSSTKPKKGIHLHWDLPAGFKQGEQQDDDSVDFPLIPNRWLIVRYQPGGTTQNRHIKAWVLQSDYVDDPSNSTSNFEGTSPYIYPYGNDTDPAQATLLGKSNILSDYTEPSPLPPFLKALAPGNISFAAYRPNVENVLSFIDDATDGSNNPLPTPIDLSYLVVGWFSDASNDPLHGLSDAAEWAEEMIKLKWLTNISPYSLSGVAPPQKTLAISGYGDLSQKFSQGTSFTITGSTGNDGSYTIASDSVYDTYSDRVTITVTESIPSSQIDGYIVPPDAPSTWPQQTLTHGFLYGVKWQNDSVPVRPNSSNSDVSNNVKLAVGNSSIDALAAMVTHEAETNDKASAKIAELDAELLEAFQYNLLPTLDEPGGQARLDQKLRDPWYENIDGGTLWRLVPTPPATPSNPTPDVQPDTAQQSWLAQLNTLQQGLDRETRVLQSMQYELYSLWWKVQRINVGAYQPGNIPDQAWQRISPEITQALPTEASYVDAQQKNVADWQAKVTALISQAPSTQVASISTPLQENANFPLTLKASKMPRFYQPNDPVLLISGLGASLNISNPQLVGQDYLMCRFEDEIITSLDVNNTVITTTEMQAKIATLPNSNLPCAISSLTTSLGLESSFLDADNASLIATVGNVNASEVTAAIHTGDSFNQPAPDPSAAAAWQQAWVPLFIDWQINFYPTVEASMINPDIKGGWGNWKFNRKSWEFDGRDYNWSGFDVDPTSLKSGLSSMSYQITAVDSSKQSFSIKTKENPILSFPNGGLFSVQGSSQNNGSYTVNNAIYTDGILVITVIESIPDNTIGGCIIPEVETGAAITYSGRTFLTPKATFNFRARLQQFIHSQKLTGDEEQLKEVAHLLDIIGGVQYAIKSVNPSNQTFIISSTIDLVHLFTNDSTCFIANSSANNGTYTVASTDFDETANTFSVTVKETISSSDANGELIPEPHQWDLLSQSLSGFTSQCVLRDLNPNVLPSGLTSNNLDVASLIEDQDHGVPMLTGDTISASTSPPYFFPVRGGYFAMQDCAIVDRFGQKLDLLFANGNNQQSNPNNAGLSFSPIRSRWVAPEKDTNASNPSRLLKLPPRVASPSRLDFCFVSAPDTNSGPITPDIDITLVSEANPVCGWILPNHLDGGLMIYNAGGAALGELNLHEVNGQPPTINWTPVPMSSNPITKPCDPLNGIPNQYLRDIVSGLFSATNPGEAFENFLAAIDETLWTVDPLGGRSDQNLSVLIGRPLAIVRARTKLSLQGHAPQDQTTKYSAPTSYPIGQLDQNSNALSITGMPIDLSTSALFTSGGTIRVTGSTENDGVYHIKTTSYSKNSQAFTVFLEETLSGTTADGNILVSPPIGELTSIPFDIRLGRSDLYNDGLIGYFSDNDYSQFNNVHTPIDIQSDDYLKPIGIDGNYLSATFHSEISTGPPPSTASPSADPTSTYLTMLVDPRANIHATTGLLPTVELTLSPEFYEVPLAKMELTFRTGPLLVDPQAIRMPRPTEQHGKWSWVQHNTPGNDSQDWQEDPVAKEYDTARLPEEPLQLRDGWLKLSNEELEK